MSARTSLSHPLQIAEVTVPGAKGRIGITFCPGKKQPDALTGAWDRDVGIDLDAIRDWGAVSVITLVEPHELRVLGVPDLGAEVRARGIKWLHLPISDFCPPDHRFEEGWSTHGERLCGDVRSGARVLVHCKGGLGRAGAVAAILLIDLDTAASEAISLVRTARKGAIETREQESYVRRWRMARGA